MKGKTLGRIVFGWEFGASLGHIYPLLRIADAMSANGHEIIFICRDVEVSRELVKKRGYSLIQAPFWKNPPIPNIRSIPTPSYADVIARQGFGFEGPLRSMLSAWCDILDLLKPDLIIADHSPGLSLAARGNVPMINVGNGFTLPPSDLTEFPAIITTGKPLFRQENMLRMFNAFLNERGRPLIKYLPQIFDTEGQFSCTLPQLDPYAKIRRKPVSGPLEESMEPADFPGSPHVFLYMANEATDSELALKAVQNVGVPATVYIRGAKKDRLARYQSDTVTMLENPVDFSEMLPKTSVVMHSGGGGTATSCLMVGRPQIMFPRQSESSLNGRLLMRRGLAHVIDAGSSLDHLTETLKGVLNDQEMKERCLATAKELSTGDWKDALGKIVRRAEELID